LIAGQLKNVPAKKAEVQSMAIAAALIGALTLARIVRILEFPIPS